MDYYQEKQMKYQAYLDIKRIEGGWMNIPAMVAWDVSNEAAKQWKYSGSNI